MKTAIAVLLLFASIGSAHAALALWTGSCTIQQSVTGQQVWVGVYQYNGQLFQRAFREFCPSSIEVY